MAEPLAEWVAGSITIGGQEIPVKSGFMVQRDLRFYEDNPRIYSIVNRRTEIPSQREIEQQLGRMDHVKQLVSSIRANGGLIDPLIVREGDNVVLEGNSRLAAYRLLAPLDPFMWSKVKVTLLPEDIEESQIFGLLGEYHIIGRKDWAPYEQAGYLYRRVNDHGVSATSIGKEMGLSVREINRLVEVYSFMVEHGEEDVNRWSYYEEYIRPRISKTQRQIYPELDQAVVDKVRSHEIETAVDVRNKVITILKGGDKSIKILMSGPDTLERALISASDRGADNLWLARMKKFRQALSEERTVGDFREMNDAQRKKVRYEVDKIERLLKKLRTELE